MVPFASLRVTKTTGGSAQAGLELLPVTPAQPQLGAAPQHHVAVTREPGLDLRHPVEIDDDGAVDPPESRRVQLRLERGQWLANEMGGATRVDPDVVPGGLQVVDLVHRNHSHPA